VLLFQTVEIEVTDIPFSSVFSPLLLLCFLFFFLFFFVCFSPLVPLSVSVSSLSLSSHSPSPLFQTSSSSFLPLSIISFLFFSSRFSFFSSFSVGVECDILSYHLNKIWCQPVNFQISPQFILCSFKSSNAIFILKINSIASLPTLIADPIIGCIFHFSSWF